MMKMFLKTYFLVCLFTVMSTGWHFISKPIVSPEYLYFHTVLNWISSFTGHSFIYLTSYLLSFLFAILNILRSSRLLRVIFFLLFLLFISLKYSFGTISHPVHIWIYSTFIMCFIFEERNIDYFINKRLIMSVRVIFFSIYLNAGLWKVRGLMKSMSDLSLINALRESSQEAIGVSIAHGRYMNESLYSVVQLNENLVIFGFVSVILFQLSCIIPILLDKFVTLYLVGVIIFHTFTGIALGHWYLQTVYMALFLLWYQSTLQLTNKEM